MNKRVLFFCTLIVVLVLGACGSGEYYEEPAEVVFAAAAPIEFNQFSENSPISSDMVSQILSLGLDFEYLSTSSEDTISLEYLQNLLNQVDSSNLIQIQLTDENRHLATSYPLFASIFRQLIINMGGFSEFSIIEDSIIILANSSISSDLPNGHIVTNKGHFIAQNKNIYDLLDTEIRVLRQGNVILAITEIINNEPTLENAFITSLADDTVRVFIGGVERQFNLEAGQAFGSDSPQIVNIQLAGGYARVLEYLPKISGIINLIGDDFIYIEEHGRLPLSQSFLIYNFLGEYIETGSFRNLTIGHNVADFAIRDGQIAAAIVLRHPLPEYVRVVLNTTGFANRIHNAVSITSSEAFTVVAGALEFDFEAGHILNITPLENEHLFYDGRLRVQPQNGGRMQVLSISRAWPGGQSPSYRGIIEINQVYGGFLVINELLLEEYLYAVIPSEMPSFFGLEAAKVQAITARSYAYNQFFSNRFYRYGANLDDSVMSQVYNNIPENDISIEATRLTRGQMLAFNGNIVSANFFSTSAGVTANRMDVWINHSSLEFDNPAPSYLQGGSQMVGQAELPNLQIEDNARAFFADTTLESYDDNSPWFRWNFDITNQQLTEIINRNLPAAISGRRNLTLTLQEEGDFAPQNIDSIGDFQSLEIVSRGQMGNIREIIIQGSEHTIKVRTEYNIRRLLAPASPNFSITMNRFNASPVINHFMLPSTFFAFDATENGLHFFGGGFGHGVGMSQHGAFGKTQRGYSYYEILLHFYPGTSIVQLGEEH